MSLVKMLHHVTCHQPIVRHLLSMNRTLYMELLQICFLFIKNDEIRFYSSCLLSLMLFDETFVVENEGNMNTELLLPVTVVRRYCDLCYYYKSNMAKLTVLTVRILGNIK